MKKEKIGIGIYARVSDDKKKSDGERRQDINRQLELLRNHLKKIVGVSEWKEYADDNKSGWTDDLNQRPAFKKLRSDVFRHKIKKVYVEAIDRFSSNMIAGMGWLREYSDIGNCTVVSIAEGEYEITSDDGWAKSTMFLFMAEWRIRNLRSKIKSGMERRKSDIRCICKSCKVVHIGRHPNSCKCTQCIRNRMKKQKHPRNKRGGQKQLQS